jgi:hypothetical protein
MLSCEYLLSSWCTAVWREFLRQSANLFCSLKTVIEANNLSVPQFEDSYWGKQTICTPVWGQFLRQRTHLYHSLRTVLEAISPSVLQSEDSYWGKQPICTAVWGQFLRQKAHLSCSLRTVLEARKTAVPMTPHTKLWERTWSKSSKVSTKKEAQNRIWTVHGAGFRAFSGSSSSLF